MKNESEKTVHAVTKDDQQTGELLVEVIENQLKENNPSETSLTLERLIAIGESRENAMRYIASVLSIEMIDVMRNEKPFDEDRYINNLKALPEMPAGYN